MPSRPSPGEQCCSSQHLPIRTSPGPHQLCTLHNDLSSSSQSAWNWGTQRWAQCSSQPLVNPWSTVGQPGYYYPSGHEGTLLAHGQPLVNPWSTVGQQGYYRPSGHRGTLLAHGQPLVSQLPVLGLCAFSWICFEISFHL